MKKFDKLDLDIISELNSRFKTDLITIGKKLGVSHATVKYRIDNMRRKNLISRSYNLNINELNMEFYCVLINANNPEQVRKKLANCAKVVSYYSTLGEYNLLVLVLAENMGCMDSMMNNCSSFNDGGIARKTVLPLLNYSSIFREINLNYRSDAKRLCSADGRAKCLKCISHKNKVCQGCPTMEGYFGDFK